MKKKNRLIRATMVLTVHIQVEKDAVPEAVLGQASLTIDPKLGHISAQKTIHTAITAIKKLK